MSEGGEGSFPTPQKEFLKTLVGKKLVKVALGGNQDNGLDFKSVRVVGRHLREIDDEIPEKGLPFAVKDHFQKLGYNIEPQFQADEDKKILEKNPVLVVATHPYLMDPVNLIGSLPESRKDTSVVGNTAFQSLGDNFSDHVIPIYRSGNNYHVEGRALLWRKYGLPQEEHTFYEAGKLNKQSIDMAAQRINEGGIVIFLPDGSTEGKEWYPGVGELVKQIGRDDARVVFAVAEKPRMRDYVRASSKVARYLPPATSHVFYSQPHLIEEFASSGDKRQAITQNLKQTYESFVQVAV